MRRSIIASLALACLIQGASAQDSTPAASPTPSPTPTAAPTPSPAPTPTPLIGPGYRKPAEVEAALTAAAAKSGGFIEMSNLLKDPDGGKLWLATAGSKRTTDPAILVVGGLDGRHLVGTEMVLRLAEDLAGKSAEDRDWLSSTTLFLIPQANSISPASFFADGGPREERAGLPEKRDADHDLLTGEDMRDDLNGDGILSTLRIEDPRGTSVSDGENDELLRSAKGAEGEKGRWLVVDEGRDDDGDETYNEEADAGTNLARNFPNGYDWFAKDVGIHAVCEPQTRAIADFIVANPRIAAVVVYGPEDNLLNSPAADKTSEFPPWFRQPNFEDDDEGPRKPPEFAHKTDVPLIRRIGELYRKDMGLSKEVNVSGAGNAAKGSLGAWTYFSRGRLSIATPVWTPEMQVAMLKEPSKEEETRLKKHDGVKSDQRFLDWLRRESPESFLGWSRVEIPGKPGVIAEVGGLAPFSRLDPPPALLNDLATTHTMLVKRLAGQLPRVGFVDTKLTALGGGVYELKGSVTNTGYLPDVLGMGAASSYVRPTRLEIDPGEGAVLGDTARIMMSPLAGTGGREEFRRIVRIGGASPSLRVKLVSELGTTQELVLSPTSAPGGVQ